jgi:hypothetical protein
LDSILKSSTTAEWRPGPTFSLLAPSPLLEGEDITRETHAALIV